MPSLEGYRMSESESILGLLCYYEGRNVLLCNPVLQKFITLPEFPEVPLGCTECREYLCFGDLGDKKKMKLLLVRRSLHSKFQDYHILPVGEESWRAIGCKHRFLPATKTLCNRGRLYFGAKSFPSMDCILMSFDLRSEEFHRIDIPSEFEDELLFDHMQELYEYEGEIAIADSYSYSGVIRMWIWNEISGEWWKKQFEIPIIDWRRETDGEIGRFYFCGFIRSGKLVFASSWLVERMFCVLHYDPFTKNLRKFKIEGMVGGDPARRTLVFAKLNHVDSAYNGLHCFNLTNSQEE